MPIYVNHNYGTITDSIETLILSDKTIVIPSPARPRSQSVKTPPPTSSSPTKPKSDDTKPYTISYICSEEQMRFNRLHAVMILMQNWQWISPVRDMEEQFEPLFSGFPKDCHIDWKPNQAILFEFLTRLFEQPFIEHQPRQSVSAIMRNQFHIPSPKSNIKRVPEDERLHITQILNLLNPLKPLPRMA